MNPDIVIKLHKAAYSESDEIYRIPTALRGELNKARDTVHELAQSFNPFSGSTYDTAANEIILYVYTEVPAYNEELKMWKSVMVRREDIEAFVNYLYENVPVPKVPA